MFAFIHELVNVWSLSPIAANFILYTAQNYRVFNLNLVGGDAVLDGMSVGGLCGW